MDHQKHVSRDDLSNYAANGYFIGKKPKRKLETLIRLPALKNQFGLSLHCC